MDHETLDDDRLLVLLGEVLDRIDPVPADATATAVAADIGGVDAQLAELVFDSLLDERAVAVRDEPGADVRSLTFTAGTRTIEVDVSDADVVGRVEPAGPGTVELEQPRGRRSVALDDLGRFRAPLAPGPLRLRLGVEGTAVATPWITR
jgi:hypothetical protein